MKQPEALRLADMIEQTIPSKYHQHEAAAELRRLHEANQAMLDALKRASGELYLASSYRNTYEVLGLVNDAIAKGEQP